MLKILISGACGAMGKMVASVAENTDGVTVTAGVDAAEQALAFPVYKSFADIKEKPDVIIDFSNVSLLEEMLRYAQKNSVPIVIGTTGYSEKQLKMIDDASKNTAVFKTANLSLGVNVLCRLVKQAALLLGADFDIEIVEKHHHNKLDAPSGTALMLADTANSVFNDRLRYEYDRHSKRAKRTENEIGIHSVRGGTIVGEHEVIFAGNNEVISLSHTAESRTVFAAGAIKAAIFIADKKTGFYNMDDLLNIGGK